MPPGGWGEGRIRCVWWMGDCMSGQQARAHWPQGTGSQERAFCDLVGTHGRSLSIQAGSQDGFAPGCLEPPPPSGIGVPLAVLAAPAPSTAGEGEGWDAGACSQPEPQSFPHCARDPDQSPGQALRLELLEAGAHSCVLAGGVLAEGRQGSGRLCLCFEDAF